MNVTTMAAAIVASWTEADFVNIGAAIERDFPDASDWEIERALDIAEDQLREDARKHKEHAAELRKLVANRRAGGDPAA